MKKIYTTWEPASAYLLKHLLELEGIETVIQGEDLFTIRGGIPFKDSSPAIWIVNDEDLERAEQVVADFEDQENVASTGWQCPVCGEKLDKQFTACWNCGAERPQQKIEGTGPPEAVS